MVQLQNYIIDWVITQVIEHTSLGLCTRW